MMGACGAAFTCFDAPRLRASFAAAATAFCSPSAAPPSRPSS